MENKFQFIPKLLQFAEKIQDVMKIVNAGIKGYEAFMKELKSSENEQ